MNSDLLVTTPHWRSAYWRCWAATSRWRAANSRWRAAWFAFSGPRSRITVLGVLPLLRQCDVWLAAGWATANGACAREPHRPPRSAWWRAKPAVGLVVWVSGRRPHSRLPQSLIASHSVDERMSACQTRAARAWAGERIPGPPAPSRPQRAMATCPEATDQKAPQPL